MTLCNIVIAGWNTSDVYFNTGQELTIILSLTTDQEEELYLTGDLFLHPTMPCICVSVVLSFTASH